MSPAMDMANAIVVELGFLAVGALGAGTFVAPLDRWLPWGRAYRRWRNRRVAAGIRQLGARCDALDAEAAASRTPQPCGGYRMNAAPCPTVGTPTQSASALARWRARRDAAFVTRLESAAHDIRSPDQNV